MPSGKTKARRLNEPDEKLKPRLRLSDVPAEGESGLHAEEGARRPGRSRSKKRDLLKAVLLKSKAVSSGPVGWPTGCSPCAQRPSPLAD